MLIPTKKGVPVEELLFAFLSVYILSLRKQVAPLTGSVKVKTEKAKIICERAFHYLIDFIGCKRRLFWRSVQISFGFFLNLINA